MNRYLRIALYCFALAALVILYAVLEGCTPLSTQYREAGFNQSWEGWRLLQGQPAYAETEIRVKVIVGGDRCTYSAGGAHDREIRVPGKWVDGKIVPAPCLGHEVEHALQFQDGRFYNPDR